MDLLAPKLELFGRKVLCIDDLIAPEKLDRDNFLRKSRLKEQDVIFADSYLPALELVDRHSEIGLAVVDIRIPEKSEDLSDYNANNPGREWGLDLIGKIAEIRRAKGRDISIEVMSAYTTEDLFVEEHRELVRLVESFYHKPVDYESFIKKLEFLIQNNWQPRFDYSFLDQESSVFVQERTERIKRLARKTIYDLIDIGHYLIEVKEKLGHGNYYNWLFAEFNWSPRSAERFMNVAKRFGDKCDILSDLNILPSALYQLAVPSTPDTAVEEAIERAKAGEVINQRLASGIRDEHISLHKEIDKKLNAEAIERAKKNKSSEKKDENKEPKITQLQIETEEKKSGETTPKVSKKIEQPKQTILGIQREKPAKNTWWQLGEDHQLFCGEPKSDDFLKKLPSKIPLAIHFIPNNDFSSIPPIKSDSTLILGSNHNEIDLEAVVKTVRDWAQATAKRDETVVFCYLFDLKLLELAVTNKYKCFIAEPDLDKCDRLLPHWRQKESVKRIVT